MKGSLCKLISGRNNIRQGFLQYSYNRIMKIMRNYVIRKILTVAVIAAFILQLTPLISSCTRQASFGNLTICSEIDMDTFAPLEVENSFDIGAQKIFATIEVSEARAEDIWRFTWINEDTKEIIADSTGQYSKESSGYIEGYLSNYVIPGEGESIIGEPGNYRVNFYHNSQFITSADFVIEIPESEVTEVVLSSEIDEVGHPTAVTESFYPDDIIYTLVKLNYQIKGEIVSVKWYRGENELLGQKEFTINKNYYLPDYITFMITNDELWPIDSYRIEVFCNGLMNSEYHYEIVRRGVPDATFSQGNICQNEDYKFYICYPDDWKFEKEESEKGLRINFVPNSDNINVAVQMQMQILKEGFFPPEEENYSGFADEMLSNVVDSSEAEEVQKTESTGEVDGITYRQINYHYPGEDEDGWDVDLVFMNKNNMLYLFLKVSDIYHKRFADKVYESMLDSLSFD
jgi:hypothetical protein